jgi:hypothetical protein
MRIFLSSTFVDLAMYREAAKDALERLGLEVGRMEVFGARPQAPAAASLDEITRCDLFVGIYARRYGSVSSRADVSITEQEFDWARRHAKPMFCFVLADDHPWPEEFVDTGHAGARLAEFRRRVAQLCVVDVFREPLDLAVRVATSVGRYLSQHPELLATRAGDQQARMERDGLDDLIDLLDSREETIQAEVEQEWEKICDDIDEIRRPPRRMWSKPRVSTE